MISPILIAATIAVVSLPANASETGGAQLSLENRTLLRCAAAFALVTSAQERGDEASLKWPKLGERGREFFVRALAQVMDDTGYDREAIAQATSSQAEEIRQSGDLDRIMPACLVMLEDSGA